MKKKLIIFVCAASVTAAIAFWRLNAPFRVIRQLDARYKQVQPGMSTNQVQAVMNYHGYWHTNAEYRGWDDAPLPSDVPRISCAVAYSVSTFFLPVTFEFVFDVNGKVVGSHRYD